MKKKKLLKKLQNFFDLDERRKKAHRRDLIKILKKLKVKENKLREELTAETSQEKKSKLQKELDIIYAQRNKGIKLLKGD